VFFCRISAFANHGRSCDIANDAFKDAVHICSTNFPPDEVQAWMNNKVGSTDLLKEVNKARTMYQDRRHCKARKWLTRLSARITLYGSVLDVLAQHHPEYVALAWGSIKFVVIVSPD
jgi:hypothetical protein